MWSQSSIYLLCIFALVLSVSSNPILEERATPRCTPRDLAIVKRTVINPFFFCKWWQEDTRTRTPFLEFTVSQVNDLCACIAPVSNVKPTKHKRAPVVDSPPLARRSTTDACRREMSIQFTEPNHFCAFYNAYPRTSSPFLKYATKDLIKLCNCVQGKVVSTSTKKTSTSIKQTSTTTKKTSTSIKKTSTTTKNTSKSTTKPLSSSTKKTSSSTISKASSSSTGKTSSSVVSSTTNQVSTNETSSVSPISDSSSSAVPSSTSACLPPRYPGGYGYLTSNYTEGNTCGVTSHTPPPQSEVLSVHQIFPYRGNCIQLCLDTDGCESFSLDSTHTECTLYNTLAEQYVNHLDDFSDEGNDLYEDASCYMCSDTIQALACNELSSSPPAGSSCGQLGLSSAAAQAAGYDSEDNSGGEVNNCALRCMSDLDCLSFSTSTRQDICVYYNQTASTIANQNQGGSLNQEQGESSDQDQGESYDQTLYDFQCWQANDLARGCGRQR